METASRLTASFDPSSPANLPSFLLLFVAVYLLGYFLIFRSWKSSHLGASCLMSLFHGTPAVIMASHALLTTPCTTEMAPHSFASPNTAVESSVLDFSIAYFTIDLMHYLIFLPNDFFFIIHHIVDALRLRQVPFRRRPWCSCASPPLARRVRELLYPPFYLFYTAVRGLADLVALYDMRSGGGKDSMVGLDIVARCDWLGYCAQCFVGLTKLG